MVFDYFHVIEYLLTVKGPIIRTGSNEIHIRNSDYLDTLYTNIVRLDKDPQFYGSLDKTAAPNISSKIVY